MLLAIHGEIDTSTRDRVYAALEAAQFAAELHIDIDSCGGQPGAAIDIYAAIISYPAITKTAVIRNAESAALLIAMAADHRCAVPGARITLHRAAGEPEPGLRWTADMHAASADFLNWLDTEMARLLAIRTGTPGEAFETEMQSEDSSSLVWCLDNRVIHEIRDIK
ncbi:ClpP protease-like protein [Ancylobacter aquaticus]|uniref:ClpP protease-like protein n=1 Tax=Ancylobacter aquaticus TaxID=100 RepID=A0A4R1IHX4_ANCAQ|nr:ClpP protease-like protein [Ancylobacter aquaticus]